MEGLLTFKKMKTFILLVLSIACLLHGAKALSQSEYDTAISTIETALRGNFLLMPTALRLGKLLESHTTRMGTPWLTNL